jgi:protein-tyrosine phosphatase
LTSSFEAREKEIAVIPPPLGLAYWVDPPRLMAGPYPGHADRAIAERQLAGLLDCGIRTFVNLMEEEARWSFGPYEPLLRELAPEECHFLRFEIEDHSAPPPTVMDEILSSIEASFAAERPVYLHCWGGRGRTGVVVGSYLVRRGLATPDDFVEVIAALRRGVPGTSPESDEQIEFVRRYAHSAPVLG